METISRTVSITIEQAREWYFGNNLTLKVLALNAYSESELVLTYNTIANHIQKTPIVFVSPIDSVNKIRVQCKLETIAKYFNDNWKKTTNNKGYFIGKNKSENGGFLMSDGSYVKILEHNTVAYAGIIYFKNRLDAEKAIEILGNDINSLF